MKRRTLLGGAAIAVAGGAGVLFYRRQPPGQTLIDLGAANADDTPSKADPAKVDTSMIKDMVLGDPKAPVTIIEYASFTCPHCAHFHAEAFEQLRKNYIDTGKVKFIYREVYFDRFGLWAAMLARCGGEQRYFGIVDILFDTQSEWLAGGDPNKAAENLRKIGLTAGLTKDQIVACMNDGDMAKALVAKYQESAAADDITGTPTFIINGTKYSNMEYAEMAKIVDAELAKG